MRTLETKEEITIGLEIRFAELWDGNGDGVELLSDGDICVGYDENDMPVIVAFDIIEDEKGLKNLLERYELDTDKFSSYDDIFTKEILFEERNDVDRVILDTYVKVTDIY